MQSFSFSLTEFRHTKYPHIMLELDTAGHQVKCLKCGESEVVPSTGEDTITVLNKLSDLPFVTQHGNEE